VCHPGQPPTIARDHRSGTTGPPRVVVVRPRRDGEARVPSRR
jgi:hypothetical protein